MEKIKAKMYEDKIITLNNTNDLDKIIKICETGDNFIISWKEKTLTKSRVIFGTNLLPKIKNAEVVLYSEEVEK